MLSLYRNKIRTINIVLITKSYDKSAWCNFSVHCLIIYPLTETSESYSVDKCYKEIKEKAKEHNVFYYSLYLYRYEVPNSVGKIKVDDVETPFFKGLRFYNKKQ